MKKFLLVSGMINTTNAFKPLVAKLKELGHEAELLEGVDAPKPEEVPALIEKIKAVDAVFSGIAHPSTPPNDFAGLERFVVQTAANNGIPFGFFADQAGSYNREWTEPFRTVTSFLAVRTEGCVEPAKKVFSAAEVVAVGHPRIEEAAYPRYSREEVRAKLLEGGVINTADEKIVLLTGSKVMEANREMLQTAETFLREAQEAGHLPVTFLFLPHPGVTGEKARAAGKEIPLEVYRQLAPGVKIVDPAIVNPFTSDDVLTGADCYVYAIGTGLETAIYRGIPAVVLRTPPLSARADIDVSAECKNGAVFEAIDADLFHVALDQALSPDGASLLAANRAVHYPKPPPRGMAANRMAELLLRHPKKSSV